ncbi:beta-galactosidase [Haloarcula halophila]|uniref:beta-galactosidase n=1 Tax=Haloarcula TaxID=2237 RepID=UPI0023E436CC|nr:beta-galactosidase [Halomicroarcula sp. DFY41]
MTVGVCYFPEHWDESTWEGAVERMAEAGIETVRLGEFAWGRLEPAREEFDFAWLDTVLDLLADHDREALLCTPTATPPKWLVDERPSVRRVAEDGTVEGYGSRREYCFNSTAYRAETERVVSRLAERYANRDVVVGWQIDNEYGCHGTVRCYCDECAEAFRTFLREHYDDAATLNEAWGTAFWSQQYDSIDAVEPPRPTPSAHHPSLLLDYARFASRSVVKYNALQAALLREANDGWTLTHNTMGQFEELDLHALGETVDFLSWDSYPTGFVQTREDEPATVDELRAGDPDELALNHALCRGATTEPFWVMEQQPGDINWSPTNPQPGEGAMSLWALHATGHGADTVVYFRWRACSQGQEQYHSGLLNHAGQPDRGYDDATVAADDIRALPSLPQPEASVAVLHDYENAWALREQPHAPDFHYWTHLRTYFDALQARGVTVDIRHPADSLDGYDAAVAPTLYLVSDGRADHLESYVRDGGTLLLTVRAGFKTPHNRVHETPRPGPLRSLVGATVTEHETIPDTVDTTVHYRGESYDYRTWGEWLESEGARIVGTYPDGAGSGSAAITIHEVGEGAVTYVGVWPERRLADTVCTDLLSRAGVPHRDEPLPDGVRVAQRGDHCFVTNFTSDRVRVDRLSGDPVVGRTPLGGYDYLVGRGDATELGVAATDLPD